jgi:hypothetical protein
MLESPPVTAWEQIRWWLWYMEIDPLGQTRDDIRMGIMTSSLVNNVRAVVGGKKFTKPSDFIPDFGKRVREAQRVESATHIDKQWEMFKECLRVQGKRVDSIEAG